MEHDGTYKVCKVAGPLNIDKKTRDLMDDLACSYIFIILQRDFLPFMDLLERVIVITPFPTISPHTEKQETVLKTEKSCFV